MKKSQSIIKTNKISKTASDVIAPIAAIAVIFGIWFFLSGTDVMPSYMMPSPLDVIKAFAADHKVLWEHGLTTLGEAMMGLGIGIAFSFLTAMLMDACKPVYSALYPLIIVTQTIPSIAIAPLLMLWMGYGILPKIVLVAITTFFPVCVSLLEGFKAADEDTLNLLRIMGAGKTKRFWYVKFPYSLGYFFSGLKISVTYAVVGAVISEWMGGQSGLGVYMTRVRKSFAYDKMFAIIIYIAVISLLLILITNIIKWLAMPWERKNIK
mgnify:CR=1 FL=1